MCCELSSEKSNACCVGMVSSRSLIHSMVSITGALCTCCEVNFSVRQYGSVVFSVMCDHCCLLWLACIFNVFMLSLWVMLLIVTVITFASIQVGRGNVFTPLFVCLFVTRITLNLWVDFCNSLGISSSNFGSDLEHILLMPVGYDTAFAGYRVELGHFARLQLYWCQPSACTWV